MKSTKHLRLRLRVIEGALLLLFGALTTAAVSTHQLLLDAANHPTGNVDLTDSHWTGTLNAARLPASVPLCDSATGDLTLPAGIFVGAAGGTAGYQVADSAGGLYAGGAEVVDSFGNGALSTLYTTGDIYSSAFVSAGGGIIGDADGFLRTGNQPYVDNAAATGPVTPTGYLLLRDSNGDAYRIPAVLDTP